MLHTYTHTHLLQLQCFRTEKKSAGCCTVTHTHTHTCPFGNYLTFPVLALYHHLYLQQHPFHTCKCKQEDNHHTETQKKLKGAPLKKFNVPFLVLQANQGNFSCFSSLDPFSRFSLLLLNFYTSQKPTPTVYFAMYIIHGHTLTGKKDMRLAQPSGILCLI